MSTELTPEQQQHMQNRIQEAESNSVVKILKIMREHFGVETYQVYARAQGENIRSYWSEKAEKAGDNSIEALIKHLWEPLRAQGYEYTMEETDSEFQMNCTKCPAYEMAKCHGDTEMKYYLACEGDFYVAEGWNPNIGFKRTRTLMQGDDCCDHFYYYKDKNE